MKYKITISEVDEVRIEKTTEQIFHKETGKKIDWFKWYKLSDEEKENYDRRQIPTGEIEIEQNEKKIYEQEIAELDIGELAIFINRAK